MSHASTMANAQVQQPLRSAQSRGSHSSDCCRSDQQSGIDCAIHRGGPKNGCEHETSCFPRLDPERGGRSFLNSTTQRPVWLCRYRHRLLTAKKTTNANLTPSRSTCNCSQQLKTKHLPNFS